MATGPERVWASQAALCVWLSCLALGPATRSHAEQLPFRYYGLAEGLQGRKFIAMHQDRRGYLWFAGDGLSRFDGYRFVSYGVRDGLGNPAVNTVTEDRDGRLWVGTNGAGVARLVEEPPGASPVERNGARRRGKFVSYSLGSSSDADKVNDMAFDAQGALWCLTDHGLYRGDPVSFEFEAVLPRGPYSAATPLLIDSRGRLWAGMIKEIVLIERGQVERWEPPERVAAHHVRAIVEDPQGRILAANHLGLFAYRPPAAGAGRGSWIQLPLTLAPMQEIRSMWAMRDGTLWIGTTHGLLKYVAGRQSLYTTAHGLKNDFIDALLEDRERNLWVGTNAGPTRLAGEGVVSWTRADGLPDEGVNMAVEAQDGRLYVGTHRGGFVEIVGGRALPIPGSRVPPFNPVVNTKATEALQNRRGDWWVTTWTGVHLLRGPGLQFRHGRRLGPADGIAEGTYFGGGNGNIHEDPAGRIWIGSQRGLYRYDPSKRGSPSIELLPLVGFDQRDEICSLVTDGAGSLWLITHSGIARVVAGRIERLDPIEGLPGLRPQVLLVDSRGRLWVGLRNAGLIVTADPGATKPRWHQHSTADGLSSDNVRALAEDGFGRIFVGTTRGLDRLDPVTGQVRTLTSRDGLAGDSLNHLLVDRRGRLWVATSTGLTRLDPRSESPPGPPPPVYFARVQVAGEELWLPERGARGIPALRLAASRNNLLIEYLSLSFRTERSLRYQYRLDGVDTDWSPPSDQRSVNYARLAAGSYRFLVRAVTAAGQASPEPASLAFTIAPPLWQRRWFLAAALAVVALAAESLHRLRLRRRLELEAVRTRIATDLHDDIGSNLSRIAILTEVARRDIDGRSPATSERLAAIASVSRDLVDSMSDIVWAVNPARDRLRDLTSRMRRFADDVLTTRDIGLRFRAPTDGDDVPLGADMRRELFLVFKEAINNVARHSGCRSVEIEMSRADGGLSLQVADDGHGFDPVRIGEAGNGNGLASMKHRAENLGGTLAVASRPGEGTTLTLRVPLGRRGWAGGVLGR